jgi:hypothetical protein
MIYVHNMIGGNNVYTRLDDVLKLNKEDDLQKESYERLGNVVNSNYETYNQKMRELRGKTNNSYYLII